MICMNDSTPSFAVLGVKVHLLDMEQVLDLMHRWIIKRDQCRYIVATGMHGVMEARRDQYFATVLRDAALLIPDGFSLVVAARLRGFKITRRVSGPDLMWEACKKAERASYRMYFYGDTVGTLEELQSRLKHKFPNLVIVGSKSPPFHAMTDREILEDIQDINQSKPDILWVGLGLPKQEKWMKENKDRLTVPVAIGVGAAFRFLSGKSRRAPSWIGNNGFEWLWRLAMEPRRVWRRVLWDGPRFVFLVLVESLDLFWSAKTK